MDIIQYFISEDLIYALGWTVMHSLWQGFLIAILMALTLQVLRKKSAKTRYEVATFSLFLVLISSICTFIWYFESASGMIEQELTTVIGEVSSVDQVANTTILQGFTQSCIDYFNTHLPAIVMLWLIGVAFFVLRLFGGLAYVQRLKHHRLSPLTPYWEEKVQAIAAKIPTRKVVRMFESASVKVPMVIGYFKPFILLPIGTINQLDEKEIEAIIAHELAHVFRNDFLLNIFLSFIEVFFYFHPAVWWISGNIRLERENCCDDIAISVCGNSLTYAKALVRLQELDAYAPGFAMPFSGQKNQLLNRIRRILNQPQNRSNIMERLTATCFLLIAIVFMSVSANPSTIRIGEEDLEPINVFEIEHIEDDLPMEVVLDTIPAEKKILYGDVLEFTRKSGEIIEMKLDGRVISKEEQKKYDQIETRDHVMMHDVDEKGKLKKSPSGLFILESRDTVRPTPEIYQFRSKRNKQQQTVTKGTNEDGQTVIFITEAQREPVEIVVDDMEDVIIVDGHEVQDGDTAVIINAYEVRNGHFNDFPAFSTDNKLILRKDSMVVWLGEKEKEQELALFLKQQKAHERETFNRLAETIALNGEQKKLILRERKEDLNLLLKEIAKVKENQLINGKDQKKRVEGLYRELELKQKALEIDNELFQNQQNDLLKEQRIVERQQVVRGHLLEEQEAKLKAEFKNFKFEVGNNTGIIAAELKADGLIDDLDDFVFTLSSKKLKVNNKKQSSAMQKKYINLYEELTGKKMTGKSKYEIRVKEEAD